MRLTHAPALNLSGLAGYPAEPVTPRVLGWLELTLAFTLAIVLTALPIGLHLISPKLAFLFTFGSAFAIALIWPRAIPVVIFVTFCFQSTFVSMASPQVQVIADLEPMKIYSLLSAVTFWLVLFCNYLNNHRSYSPFVQRMMKKTIIVMAIITPFFIVGLLFDSRSAIIYMRNISLPLMLFQASLLIAAKNVIALRTIIVTVLSMMMICGYLEMLAVDVWFNLTNGWTFWDLSYAYERENGAWIRRVGEGAPVITSVIDLLKTDFLNASFLKELNLTITRLQGPNFHAPSFGYAMAVFGSFLAVHGYILLPILMIPLLLFVSAKGAIALYVLTILFCLVARSYPNRSTWIGLLVLLGIYGITLFLVGLNAGDYHMLGLMGGINGFLSNPLGHSLGQGGNLSVDFGTLDWSRFQAQGSTDIAIESAVGVLLYQIGIMSAVLFAIYLWMSKTAYRLYQVFHSSALLWVSGVIVIILVNGFFQEEALFAPLSFGFILSITGLTLGAIDRIIVSEGSGNCKTAGAGHE